MIIGKDLQRPGAGKKKWHLRKLSAERLAGSANFVEIGLSHEHAQLERRAIAMEPAMLRRQRYNRSFDCVAKLLIDIGGVRALMQRAQIVCTRFEIVAIGAGGRVDGRDLEGHLDFVAMRDAPRAPLESERGALRISPARI